jgi:hypothetical protein
MTRSTRTLTTEEIRRVSCPLCKAPAGSPCTEPATDAPRDRHHLDRVAVAKMATQIERPSRRPDALRRRLGMSFYRP